MQKNMTTNKAVSKKAKPAARTRKKASAAAPVRHGAKENKMVRIDARIPAHVKEIVRYAASIQGRTQTDFLVTALNDAAKKVIEDHSVIRLCMADQIALVEALTGDSVKQNAKGLARLKRAVAEHRKIVRSV